jgi:hypothetical protein
MLPPVARLHFLPRLLDFNKNATFWPSRRSHSATPEVTMNGVNGTQLIAIASFGFLAVGAIALFSFISVAHWVTTRAQERESRDRFALLKLLLEHPGDEGQRVLVTWREQEAASAVKARRERMMGGLVAAATGVGLSLMLGMLSDWDNGSWAIGLIPLFIGLTIALFGYFQRATN